uniref:RNA-directed DNA polymerase, eukaryota n=1 Tax=Tanacetum cinerariifolium TaxID=118510 RepID=A0A699JL55_TANCI|nr:RNA-directed DNA polymerase, eukaryota [Tanacetum cinerariifolium]
MLWGNYSYEFVYSPSVGFSGGILWIWDLRKFVKDNETISDSFLAICGAWVSSSTKLLIVSVYAPTDFSKKKILWDYIAHMIQSWEGECVILGYFNEVRFEHERFGTNFNDSGANAFNHFILSAGLIDLPLEGYSYTWALKNLSDHRPIIMHDGFNKIIEDAWKNSSIMETNKISLLKKKLQALKSVIKTWCKEDKKNSNEYRFSMQSRLTELDKLFDKGKTTDALVIERTSLLKSLQDLNARHSLEMAQNTKIHWAIEGDENTKYFHGIINKKRSQLAIRDIYFGQNVDTESNVNCEEIKRVGVIPLLSCLFLKNDAKLVKDFCPISLIGNFYKIIAKILANYLSLVMTDLISDVQSAFVQIDKYFTGLSFLVSLYGGVNIIKQKLWSSRLILKKAFNSQKGQSFVNGSPSSEFSFHKGLKQGDPLSLFLFILVMETLHISFNNILNARFFKGIRINESLTLSHLFYADDVIFIGTWDKANVISLVHMLNCFYMASGLKINIIKSTIMGIGTTKEELNSAAKIIRCSTFSSPFKYLGVKVGSSSSRNSFWDEVISKISSRLLKWKAKSLSIGNRFTLIKSVLTSLPLYFMSIYKAPMGVLYKLESICRNFFNGVDNNERKINMIGWKKILAAKRKGGLGVFSFFCL